MLRAHALALDSGVCEVQVGMIPVVQQRTVAEQMRREGQGHGHLAAPCRAAYQHGVRYAVLLLHLHQSRPRLALAYDIVYAHDNGIV